jgi:hypothetical protein
VRHGNWRGLTRQVRLPPAVIRDPRLVRNGKGFSLLSHRPQSRQQGQRGKHRQPQEQKLVDEHGGYRGRERGAAVPEGGWQRQDQDACAAERPGAAGEDHSGPETDDQRGHAHVHPEGREGGPGREGLRGPEQGHAEERRRPAVRTQEQHPDEIHRIQERRQRAAPPRAVAEPGPVSPGGPEGHQEPGNGDNRPGNRGVGWRLGEPGREDRYRGPADAYGQHSVFQARQRGRTHLSITSACARRLEGVLVQSASAVGEETAEARHDDRKHMPTRQDRSLLHPEDPPVGAVIASEGNEQSAHQGK